MEGMSTEPSVSKSPSEEEMWERKYNAIKKKCREYEWMNDMLFVRSKEIQKLIEKAEAETRFLVKKLEQYEDIDYPKCLPSSRLEVNGLRIDSLTTNRSLMAAASARVRAEVELAISQDPDPSSDSTVSKPAQKVDVESPKPQGKGTKRTQAGSQSNTPAPTPVPPQLIPIPSPGAVSEKSLGPPKTKKVRKTPSEKSGRPKGSSAAKKRRADVDPNAPKKPSNAFFWFCQAKRPDLQEQFKGEASTGQHDLTKALAKLWGETNLEDKKPFYEQYVLDRARYDQEMQVYNKQKQSTIPASPEQLDYQSNTSIYSVTIPTPEL